MGASSREDDHGPYIWHHFCFYNCFRWGSRNWLRDGDCQAGSECPLIISPDREKEVKLTEQRRPCNCWCSLTKMPPHLTSQGTPRVGGPSVISRGHGVCFILTLSDQALEKGCEDSVGGFGRGSILQLRQSSGADIPNSLGDAGLSLQRGGEWHTTAPTPVLRSCHPDPLVSYNKFWAQLMQDSV